MKKKILGITNREYTESAFWISLTFLTMIWTLVIFNLCQYWDYEDHIKIAQYLLIHEIDYSVLLDCTVDITHIFAYPVFHIMLKLVHLVFRIDYRTAVTVLMVAAEVTSVLIIRKIVSEYIGKTKSYYVDFLSLGLMIFLGARSWLNGWVFYKLQGGPNPLHNPTIIFVRPLGLLCFYYFIKYLNNYKNANRELILFGVFSVVSILTKPSFAVVFLPAMGVFTLIYMIKDKSILLGIKTFISVIPSLAVLLLQLAFMNSTSEIMATKLHFGTYYDYSFFQVIGITIVLLPTIIVLFSWKEIKSNLAMGIAFLAVVIGWIQFFCLTQGGTNDFIWGFELAVQMATMVVMCYAYPRTDDTKSMIIRKRFAYGLFVYQVINGLLYMYLIYRACDYRF